MQYLNETSQRISETITVLRRIRKEFLTEDTKRNMRKLRWSVLAGTLLLMATPWVFGEMIDYAINKDLVMTMMLLGLVIVLVVVRIFANLITSLSIERNFGSIYPVIDATIDSLFSTKNIKQLRTEKELAVGNITKARSYVGSILIEIWVEIERVLIDLVFAYLATVVGAILFGIPWIAVAATIGLFLALGLSAYLNTQVIRTTVPLDKRFRGYNRDWEESIQKLSDFKAQGMHINLLTRNQKNHQEIFDKDRAFWFWYIKRSQFRELLITGFIVLVPYVLGIVQVIENPKALPLIIALFSWGAIQVAALRQLARFERDLNKRIPSIMSFFKALDMEPLHKETGTRRFSKDMPFAIVLENVSHRFEDGNLVLSEITMTIGSGEKWAFIGESGSGKTTLVNLILGSMPPSEGRIFIRLADGEEIDLWDLDLDWWRSEILGYVPQDVILKDGTIRENLLLSLPSSCPIPDDRELMETLTRFEAVFRDGTTDESFLDINVGRDGGVELSGGQRQRMGIARAALKQAKCVIFDEATSSLDARMTNNVTRAFREVLAPETTSIMIAHNLATVAGGSPRRLLEGNSDAHLVCTHYLVLRPVVEATLVAPQIDYVGNWQGLHASEVMEELIEESEKVTI